MEDKVHDTCKILREPLNLGELINEGARFVVNNDYEEGLASEIFDDIHYGSDEEELDDEDFISKAMLSPWTEPFEKLRLQMHQLNESIYKKVVRKGHEKRGKVPVNARVTIRYNAYWEGESAPFDSSYLRGSSYTFYTGRGEVLPGLDLAVLSMCEAEQSHFVISYQLLFGEMGCEPRVKKSADGLFIIEVLSFTEVGDAEADACLNEEERCKFKIVFEKVKQIHLKGKDFFCQGLYKNAIHAFERAVNLLNFCHLADEKEEREQREFLVKLYTNLAVVCIKANQPSRCCIFCKEIRRLTNDSPSCKALFQEGRAYFKLGEYERSHSLLLAALRIEPSNMEIRNEVQRLEKAITQYKDSEKHIWTKAIGVIKEKDNDGSKLVENMTDFERDMYEALKVFKEDPNSRRISFNAVNFTQDNSYVHDMAKELNLNFSYSQLDGVYYITK